MFLWFELFSLVVQFYQLGFSMEFLNSVCRLTFLDKNMATVVHRIDKTELQVKRARTKETCKYSLISMRPIYYFDTWAIIWHGIVRWFMVFSPFLPVLVCCDHKIVLHWSKQKQFCDHVAQIIVNPGKSSEIN